MTGQLTILAATAASIGLVHTLIGPDHYVPFIALAGARKWSLSKTLSVTGVCGVGHVLGSVVLGGLGILLGVALGGLEWFEGFRGEIAGWLLLGFGLAYLAWGLRQAYRNRPHTHWHGHSDGTLHEHTHTHKQEHAHIHAAAQEALKTSKQRLASGKRITPWVLFLIFIFGPCEALIPILMYPAAEGSWWGVALVVAVFGLTTVVTMLVTVTVGYLGISRLPLGRLERFSHALAGLALVACGLAIQLGL
jgi:ABC-type nickel/cobalt efflux system permease component RcnA